MYFGGDNITNIIFDTIRAFNIGMNPYNTQQSHECYIAKFKKTSCTNIHLANIILQQDETPVTTVHILCAYGTNMTMNSCKSLKKATSLAVITNGLAGLIITDSYADNFGIYGGIVDDKMLANVKLVNCTMRLFYHFENVRECIGCTFKSINTIDSLLSAKIEPTYFKDCVFITTGYTTQFNFSYLNCDLFFIDCIFENQANTGGAYAVMFGSKGAQSEINIVFDGVVFETTNYTYNVYFNNVNINARVLNCVLSKISFFKCNFLQIFNSKWNYAYKLSTSANNQYSKSSFAFVFKNGDDFSSSL